MLTKRQHDILFFIHKFKQLTIQDICREFSLSDKTVRNEIKSINTISKKPIIISSNRGIEIDKDELQKQDKLLNYQTHDYLNMSHRLIMTLLFNTTTDICMDDLCDSFYISSNGLTKIVQQANGILKSFQIHIIKKHHCLSLQGSAQNKRKLLVSLIMEENKNTLCLIDSFTDAFDNIDAHHILEVVEETITSFGYKIPSHYYSNFMLNIFSIFSLNRNEKTELTIHLLNVENTELDIAKAILYKLDIKNNTNLLYEIANALTGIINHNRKYSIEQMNERSKEFVSIIKQALENTFLHFDLIIDFDNFYATFINHVHLMIKRAKTSNCFLDNSFSVKDSNIFIYDIALYFCNQIANIFNIQISEGEVSLIAIHLGFAIEESFVYDKKVHLALVTEDHDLIDTYIMNKIQNNFSEKIDIVKITDSSYLKSKNFDLVVATREFPQIQIYQHCLITPLLTETDKNKIQKAILEVLDAQAKVKFQKLIQDYFDKDLFFYHLQLHNKHEVLEYLDAKLRQQHIVDEDFLSQILKREQLSPTSFMNRFAIPHPFNCTALASKIAVLIEPDGIDWGNGSTVQCVFLIAISQSDQAILKNLFDGLAMMLCDETKTLKLKNAQTYQQLINIMIE